MKARANQTCTTMHTILPKVEHRDRRQRPEYLCCTSQFECQKQRLLHTLSLLATMHVSTRPTHIIMERQIGRTSYVMCALPLYVACVCACHVSSSRYLPRPDHGCAHACAVGQSIPHGCLCPHCGLVCAQCVLFSARRQRVWLLGCWIPRRN